MNHFTSKYWKKVVLLKRFGIGIRQYSSDYASGYRPRRSLLYVPGIDQKKIEKATTLNADVVVLDLEDGVAENRKDEARKSIGKVFPTLNFRKSEPAIRINSFDTDHIEDDLNYVLHMEKLPNAIMLPKIECKDHVIMIKSKVNQHFQKNECLLQDHVKIIGQCESAKGFKNLHDILAEAMKDDRYIKFENFVFGSDDYVASIGAKRTKDAKELIFARQFFIMHVKGSGFQATDMVDIDINDLGGLEKQCIEGSAMGFTGKQVIHPKQVNIVNQCYSPSKEEIEFAKKLVDAFDEHQLEGKGAFAFEGKMIDMPSLKQARNILNSAGD